MRWEEVEPVVDSVVTRRMAEAVRRSEGGDEVVGVPLGVGGLLAWMMEVEGRS